MRKILGLDIGGAHIKSATAMIGKTVKLGKRETIPFEIFREKQRLASLLGAIMKKTKPDGVAITMTGELSDVFKSRAQGVRWILDSALKAVRRIEMRVVDVNGRLISTQSAKRNPACVSSANWSATGAFVSRWITNGIVVDIGSTTTDILPVVNGEVAVKGKTDYERLKNGELLYTGYLRTSAVAVCPEINLDGATLSTCPEHFAIVGDAHLYLGDIKPKNYTCLTPDGRGKTKTAAGARLARLVLSDSKTLKNKGITSIATQIIKAQEEKIALGIKRIVHNHGLNMAPIIVIGPGRIYLKQIKKRLNINSFPRAVGGYPVQLLDPSVCAAGLWKGDALCEGIKTS
ncbi:4-[[4-(2-aminoethyl)phenoxy]-methyl]-2-furanmethanamine-glutamate synthase [hydrothermal vent metagenome]|uniref:4-[[4-(2-aminoethyl)phenoxy]-methyl]-2-furanmethanamine-glutamate synthase n=1 Tax=hydrothermal vent metagenome TaxID=652676 RepID=A0A3B1CE38_9ZZZZ